MLLIAGKFKFFQATLILSMCAIVNGNSVFFNKSNLTNPADVSHKLYDLWGHDPLTLTDLQNESHTKTSQFITDTAYIAMEEILLI